jgi:hypothetical protein
MPLYKLSHCSACHKNYIADAKGKLDAILDGKLGASASGRFDYFFNFVNVGVRLQLFFSHNIRHDVLIEIVTSSAGSEPRVNQYWGQLEY